MCYNISKKLWCEYNASQHKWIEDTEDNAGHCIRQTFDTEIYLILKGGARTQNYFDKFTLTCNSALVNQTLIS